MSVNDYINQGYVPDALLNGLALLGWNPPHREDPNVLSGNLSDYLNQEMIRMDEMETIFRLDKVGKSGAKFDVKKLEFLNQLHIRDRFTYYEDEQETKEIVDEWRSVMLKNMPERVHSKIR